jgi:chromosome segregation ATPase
MPKANQKSTQSSNTTNTNEGVPLAQIGTYLQTLHHPISQLQTALGQYALYNEQFRNHEELQEELDAKNAAVRELESEVDSLKKAIEGFDSIHMQRSMKLELEKSTLLARLEAAEEEKEKKQRELIESANKWKTAKEALHRDGKEERDKALKTQAETFEKRVETLRGAFEQKWEKATSKHVQELKEEREMAVKYRNQAEDLSLRCDGMLRRIEEYKRELKEHQLDMVSIDLKE